MSITPGCLALSPVSAQILRPMHPLILKRIGPPQSLSAEKRFGTKLAATNAIGVNVSGVHGENHGASTTHLVTEGGQQTAESWEATSHLHGRAKYGSSHTGCFHLGGV